MTIIVSLIRLCLLKSPFLLLLMLQRIADLLLDDDVRLLLLLVTLRGSARSRAALPLEVLALRHQRQKLQRARSPRLRLARADRLLWVWLSCVWNQP